MKRFRSVAVFGFFTVLLIAGLVCPFDGHGGECAGDLTDRADVAVNPAGNDYDVYFTDDDPADPDYSPLGRAQWVRDALSDSHDVFVSPAFNFKNPYFDVSPNDTCIFDMAPGLLGSAPESKINIDANHVETDGQQRIIETTLHELFHHVQFAYIEFNDWPSWGTWTIEGTAAMMEDKVFAASDSDTGNSYVSRVNQLLNAPNNTLTDRSYNAALFWSYITETLGLSVAEPGRGVDVVRRFWQNTEGNSPDSVKYLKEALKSYDPSATLESVFQDFSIANYTHDLDVSGLSDPAKYSYFDETAAGGGTAYNAVDRDSVPAFNTAYSSSVNRWAARYFEIDVELEKRCEAIGFWGKADGDKTLAWALIAMKSGSVVEIFTGTGNSFYRAIVNPPRVLYDRLAAVVIGLDRGTDFDYAFGWGDMGGSIRLPTMDDMAYVGDIGDPPERFQARMVLTGPGVLTPSGSGTVSLKGLDASDFSVTLKSDATSAEYPASIVSSTYVSGEYWLVIQAPEVDAADGQLYDLEICFCEDAGTCAREFVSAKSVLYTDVTRNQMLTLDRSYSMHHPSADPKLTAAKNACRAYVNSASSTDRVGFVTFSGNNSECDNDNDSNHYKVPLADVTDPHREDLIEEINRVQDDVPHKGWTSIGDGIVESRNELFLAGGVADIYSIVLLSDGLENEGDYWASPNSSCGNPAVRDSFDTGGSAEYIRIDTLAFGPDADETLLQNIAISTGGDPYPVTLDSAVSSRSKRRAGSPTDPSALEVPNRLAHAYLSIAEEVGEKDRLFFNVLNMGDGETADFTIPVTEKEGGGVLRAVFAFNWNIDTGGVSITLTDPDGAEVTDGAGNWSIHEDKLSSKAYHYDGVLPAGDYLVSTTTDNALQIMCLLSGRIVHGVDMDLQFSQVPLLEKCDFENIANYLRGLPVTLLVSVNDAKGGILGMDLEASVDFTVNPNCAGVVSPSNRLVLHDDGNHDDGSAGDGIYGNIFTRTPCYSGGEEDAAPDFPGYPFTGESGAYTVTVSASGKSNFGESFQRYISRSFTVYEYVNRECQPDTDKDGMADRWEDLHGLKKTDPADAVDDNDNDGLRNIEEFNHGTLPFDPDTDRGGESDGSEVKAGRDPLYQRDDLLPAVIDYGIMRERVDVPGFDPQPETNILHFPVNTAYRFMHIYRKDPGAANFVEIATPDLSANPKGVYFDLGLENGKEYLYYLVAEGYSGEMTPPTEIFLGIPLYGIAPLLDIKVNGSDGPVSLAPLDPALVTIGLDPNGCDFGMLNWWIFAETSFGDFYFVYPGGWQIPPQVCVQAPLLLFADFPILGSPLPAGIYKFSFAMDRIGDGVYQPEWTDSVTVEVSDCDPGLVECDGTCKNLSFDMDNCGECGNVCPTGSICLEGICFSPVLCEKGFVKCNGVCVDIFTSPFHCGECGKVCPRGYVCIDGSCAPSCDKGLINCDGICADTLTDADNCGGCGKECPEGYSCIEGTCKQAVACDNGLTDCNGECINLLTDEFNCGKCGNTCPAGYTCVNGFCRTVVLCETGLTDCNDQCVDLSSDGGNCGKCGNVCPAGYTCLNGICRPGVLCKTGLTDCNGQCLDLSSDGDNCGRCGNVCPAGYICLNGICRSVVLCETGLTDCNGQCVNLSTDEGNCGKCGNACPSGYTCQDGTCVFDLVCLRGLTDCNGTCVNLLTDKGNCGKCGNACPAGYICQDGTCVADFGCIRGLTDCNGTCVNLLTDEGNCGKCGNTCLRGYTCLEGNCVLLKECDKGLANCNGECVNLFTDNNNCGKCGNICPRGTICREGNCMKF